MKNPNTIIGTRKITKEILNTGGDLRICQYVMALIKNGKNIFMAKME